MSYPHIPEPCGGPHPLIIYDDVGEIVDWGPANTTMLQEYDVWTFRGVPMTRGLREVAAWRVLYVHVWVRNIDRITQVAVPEYWTHYRSYCVERWEQIVQHVNDYYASGGVANRYSWEVEAWLWTEQDGWEPEDIM